MKIYLTLLISLFVSQTVLTQNNPITLEWLQERIVTETPRLILTTSLENQVKSRIDSDDFISDYYQLVKLKADAILNEVPLTYEKRGRRLLGVSREALRRIATLAFLARIEKDIKYTQRLEKELMAVCSFPDWNPSHFLDVAEMAAAISIAIDWGGELMNAETVEKASKTLVSHALKPGLAVSKDNWWIDVHHNWNLVCHGGLSLAALAVFDKEPELASAILHRALEKVPLGLLPYAPDGIYPEGPSYWGYATNYLVLMTAAFETTLHTNFNIPKAKGLMESADVSSIIAGNSGLYYDFFDAGNKGFHSLQHFGLLTWFEQNGGTPFSKEAFKKTLAEQLENPTENSRFLPFYFLFLCQLDELQTKEDLPLNWVGNGNIPIGVFRSVDENGLYLAAKGGRAADNHGNMDAGSFILEWQKERFGIDMGNQDYNDLENTIGTDGLWNNSQISPRWDLLTKNNFGHSTLTINNLRHNAGAQVKLLEQDLIAKTSYFSFDLSSLFGGYLKRVTRTFRKESENTLSITDELTFAPATQHIVWQMMTQAEVEVKKKAVILTQNGKKIKLQVNNSEEFEVAVISLSPPPLPYDKKMENLKRIEFHFERNAFAKDKADINILIEGLL